MLNDNDEGHNAGDLDDCFKERPVGILNVMSNCYVNVILQCLANVPQFVYALYNYVKGKHGEAFSIVDDEIDAQFLKTNNFPSPVLSYSVSSYLQNIMCYREGEKLIISFTSKLVYLSKMHKDGKYLNLRRFLKFLSTEFFPNLKYSQHEDCQEFLMRFFEITNDLMKIENNYKNAKYNSENIVQIDQSVIKDIFGGVLEETITCGKCDYVNKIYEPFDILTINIMSQTVVCDLSKEIEHFFKKELLKGTLCEKCRSSPIYKEAVFYKQPQVLILHIARLIAQDLKLLNRIRFPLEQFSLENVLMRMENASKNVITTMRKWQHSIYQNAHIPLENKGFIEPPKQYYLTGLIEHIGLDGYRGHYICYNKRTHSNGVKQWYLFDDTNVSCVSQNVVKNAEPYFLFYNSY